MIKRWRPKREKGEDGYAVGYRRPPIHSRFKPGQSGNPKGRPKGTNNFRTDVKSTLRAPVKVTRDGRPRRVSTQEAALLRLCEKALGGDPRALDQYIQLARIYNDEEVAAVAGMSTDDAGLLEIYTKRVLSGAAGSPDLGARAESTSRRRPTVRGNADGDRKPKIGRVRLKRRTRPDDGQAD
jgi:hypothetical protein